MLSDVGLGIAAGAPTVVRQQADLVTRLRQGDQAAFAELVRTHAGRLLAVARRILSNEEDARDALQDAFLAAFQSIGGFRQGALVSTWLHRITVNAALMRLRSARRREERDIDDLLPVFDEDGRRIDAAGPWHGRGPEGQHLQAESRAVVRRAIAALPTSHRTVLVLRDIEELSTRETAELLGLTENAVKIRLHRARQALRTLLEPEMLGGALA